MGKRSAEHQLCPVDAMLLVEWKVVAIAVGFVQQPLLWIASCPLPVSHIGGNQLTSNFYRISSLISPINFAYRRLRKYTMLVGSKLQHAVIVLLVAAEGLQISVSQNFPFDFLLRIPKLYLDAACVTRK